MIYKFRAWDTQNEEFIDDDAFYIGSNGSVSVRDNYDDSVWHEGGPIILLMFTGLLDKNGVEIYYDCDKVAFEYLDRERGEYIKLVGVLHFNVEEQRAEFNIEPDKKYPEYVCLSYNFMKMRNLEVIGNIYPELLKGE